MYQYCITIPLTNYFYCGSRYLSSGIHITTINDRPDYDTESNGSLAVYIYCTRRYNNKSQNLPIREVKTRKV